MNHTARYLKTEKYEFYVLSGNAKNIARILEIMCGAWIGKNRMTRERRKKIETRWEMNKFVFKVHHIIKNERMRNEFWIWYSITSDAILAAFIKANGDIWHIASGICRIPCPLPIGTQHRKASSEWRHGFFDFCFDAYIVRAMGEPWEDAYIVLCEYTRITATCLENQNRVRFMDRRERVWNQISKCLCRNTYILTSSSPYDVYAWWWWKFLCLFVCVFFPLLSIVRCSMYTILSICRSIVSRSLMYIYIYFQC